MAQILPDAQLERAVERYEKAIAALEAAAEDLSVEHILDVLVARDAVQTVLNDKSQPHSGRVIRTVKELDLRLKQQAKYINQVVQLADWQGIVNPPEKHWWWLLDPITPKPWRDRFDWLWRFFSLMFLSASLSVVVDISTRFLRGGPDIAGVFAVIIPSLLTLLAGEGALTKTGQEGIEYILTSLKLQKAWWDEIISLGSGMLLVVLIIFWSLMPWIADHYYMNLGNKAYDAGQFTVAENNYNRALKLNPENTTVYYKLGNLSEELQDYNKAIENYKIAWKGNEPQAADNIATLYLKQQDYRQADEWLARAVEPQKIILALNKPYTISQKEFATLTRFGIINREEVARVNDLASLDEKQFAAIKDRASLNDKQFDALKNLAYVYLKKNEYSDVERWLDLGFALTKNDKKKQATMLAYQGWIQLKQARHAEAESQLRKAISQDGKLASAHCLLAQVLEKRNNQPGATMEWEQCLKYASQYNPDENTWIGLALKGLKNQGKAQ